MSFLQDLKNRPYAVPLFAFFDVSTSIDVPLRQEAVSKIDLTFRHHSITRVEANTLEAIIFAKSNVSQLRIRTFYKVSSIHHLLYLITFYICVEQLDDQCSSFIDGDGAQHQHKCQIYLSESNFYIICLWFVRTVHVPNTIEVNT